VHQLGAVALPRPAARRRSGRDWALAARPRPSQDTLALLVVGLAVVIANLPALLGLFHLDPLTSRAKLTESLTSGLLGGRPTVDPSNGFNSQAIGHLAALDLLHLHLPWWNPYEGTGMPLLGETQSAALFPPTLLTAIANGQLYEHVLLELVAGICTYRLLRRLRLTRTAAVAGAVAFALNGKFAWFSDATVNPLPFLPMLLLGIEGAVDAARTGGRGGWRLIAVAIALTAYAGFPEVAYVDVLMGVAWVVWRVICLKGSERRRFAARIGLGSAAGVLIAAPMLLAMFDYLSHADLVSHTGTQLGRRHLSLSEAPQLLMPYIYGPLNTNRHHGLWVRVGGYLSVLQLLFAVLALASPGRRGLKLLLVGWSLLVFAHMYGLPGLGDVIGVLPEISRIQFFRYATAALEMPVIILAAVGLDGARRVAARRHRLLVGAVLAMAAVGGAALGAHPLVEALASSVRNVKDYFSASIGWGLFTVAAAGVLALVRPARLRGILLALVIVVDAVALFAVPQFSAPRVARLDLAPVAYLRRHLGDARFVTLGPIRANYGSYFRLASLRVDDFPPAAYARYVHARLDPFANFVGFRRPGAPSIRQELVRHLPSYEATGMRYVLTGPRDGLPASLHGFRLVFSDPTARIYRVAHAAPFLSAAGCRVTASQIDSVRLLCRRPTTLVRRETWFPGWSARIDGRAAPIRRVDGLFQAVRLPAGADRVSFRFQPVGMDWALLALLAGCVLVLTPTARRALTRGRIQLPAGAPALSGPHFR
jgi:hypothetical protein